MDKDNVIDLKKPESTIPDPIADSLQKGARRLLMQALEVGIDHSYLRRTKSIDQLIPWLYLKGISTGDLSEALAALVGKRCRHASGDSPRSILPSGNSHLSGMLMAALRRIAGNKHIPLDDGACDMNLHSFVQSATIQRFDYPCRLLFISD